MIGAQQIVRAIQIEFTEWPALALTLPQARRLWNLPLEACEAALISLVRGGFLLHRNGVFLRRGLGRQVHGPARVPTPPERPSGPKEGPTGGDDSEPGAQAGGLSQAA